MGYKVLLKSGVNPAEFMRNKGLIHIRTESIPYVGTKHVYGRHPGANNGNLTAHHNGIHPLDDSMKERYPCADHVVTIFYEGPDKEGLHQAKQLARELRAHGGIAIINPWGDREEIHL